jgi:predicted AAA+ superfamily ATPase
MPKIKDVLRDLNPWWKEEFRIEYKQREIYNQIKKFIQLPQIMAFTGLRRVGKTTLMLKIIEDAIEEGFDSRSIIYFSFDEFRDVEIRAVMNEYEELMEREIGTGKYLLLLDEIQKLSNWENQLKSFYDVFGKRIKIIISGSESLFIRRKRKETLAGRIFEFKVELLSFKEFLLFKEVDFEPVGLYERVVYRDIAGLFKIKDISVIESLLNVIMEEPGQLIELSGLTKELKISRQTLSKYIVYLEESFLIKKLYNYSGSRRKTERKLKKYYPAVISPDLLFREDDISKSRVFECLVVNQLKAEFFWRDPYKNEVDTVMTNGEPVPIEVKYGKLDFKGLLAFMKRFNVDAGYVISRDKEETRKINGQIISVVPASKFFLL